jgi:hypothetical protein
MSDLRDRVLDSWERLEWTEKRSPWDARVDEESPCQ